MKKVLNTALLVSLAFASHAASANTLTQFSPTGTDVVARGASEIGGIVVELKGTNGVSVVSQLAASSLFVGSTTSVNPFTIGTQTGYDASVVAALGGGLQSASFRFTLYDGDTATGNFDRNDNSLLVNGVNVGNWSNVTTNTTTSTGATAPGTVAHTGFENNSLDSGWFHVTDGTLLSSVFSSLATGKIVFGFLDKDPGDQFLDFTQGIDKSLINVGSGPVVVPPTPSAVPENDIYAMMLAGLGLVGFAARRRQA